MAGNLSQEILSGEAYKVSSQDPQIIYLVWGGSQN